VSIWYTENLVLIQSTFMSVLFALSIQIPLRFGVFSFAGVGSYGVGAYTAAILVVRYHQSILPALAGAAVVSAIVGYALALLMQRLSGLYLGMATVAFDLIVSVVATNGGSFTGGSAGQYGVLVNLTTLEIALITIVVLLVFAFSERGSIGRRIEVVREDPELSSALGINVRRMREIAFVVSGALGGAAGGINVAMTTTTSPGDINFALIVLALTMIVVGGARSWLGAVIGAIVFTWLPSLLAFVGEWKGVIYGVIVALVAIWVPGGVVGVVTGASRRRSARLRSRSPELQAANSPRPRFADQVGSDAVTSSLEEMAVDEAQAEPQP
jgi:branched-chain amino acid transport system permease protein